MGIGANTTHTTSSYKDVLSSIPFRSLWFGQICSQLAVNTLLFVLALRLYQSTQSNTAVSGLFLAYGIPAVLFGMIAGTAVDHLDKRRVLMYCDLLRAALVFLLFFVSGNVLLVYVITFINALITQFYVPAEAPTIPRLVPQEHLIPANSLFAVTYYSSLAMGTVLAGPLLRLFGDHSIFIVLSLLFGLAAWNESRLPSMAMGTLGFKTVLQYHLSHVTKRVWQKLTDGLRYMKKSPVLFDCMLLLTGTQIIFMLLGTLGPGFADRTLGIDVRDVSLFIVGPAVVGILVGSIWVGNFGSSFKNRDLITLGVLSAGIILIVIAVSAHIFRVPIFLSSLLFFLLGFANSLLDVPANTLLQQEAVGEMRGRVYGMLTALVGGVGILPVITGGIVADIVGAGVVILLLGILISVYGLFRITYNKHT